MNISACIVTRGNVDLDPILDSFPAGWEVVVWDNQVEPIDLMVYGRYRALERARHDVVFVQDDDCVISPAGLAQLADAYVPGRVVCNMPRSRWDDRASLIGWGAIFDRSLALAPICRYLSEHPLDEAFLRDCDLVFTGQVECVRIDAGFGHLPYAEREGRLWLQRGHQQARAAMIDRVQALDRKVLT